MAIAEDTTSSERWFLPYWCCYALFHRSPGLVGAQLADGQCSIFIYPPKWIPDPVEWSNYEYVFSDYPLIRYLGNTLTIVIPAVLGVVASATVVAYGFSRIPWRGRELVFGILLTTLMLPYVVTLIPTFFMWSRLGFVDTYVPLILPSWFGGGVFNIFLLRQFFRTIPREYDEAATLDGANHFQILWHVIVPLSRPALITIAILSFLYHWNDFLGPLIYLSDPDKFTLALVYRTSRVNTLPSGGADGRFDSHARPLIAPSFSLTLLHQGHYMSG